MKEYFQKYFFPCLFYYGLLFLIFFLWINKLPVNTGMFLNWDAFHYDIIRTSGYDITRCAFFPLFPFIWKLTTLSAIGISVFNAITFIGTISFLLYHYKVSLLQSILLYSIPSFIFFFYPYAESLFFLTGSVLIVSIAKNYVKLSLLIILLLSLIRPTISLIGPAYILLLFFRETDSRKRVVTVLLTLFVLVTGLVLTFGIQRIYTGVWNGFFISQEKWGNVLRWPLFPLRSWGGDVINRLDGVALFISLLCLVLVVRDGIRHCFLKKPVTRFDLFFSMIYLSGAGLIVLFYRNGELYSLNRFVFCSPFFVVLLIYFFRSTWSPIKKYLVLGFSVLSLYWLTFASYVHIRALLKYELLTTVLTTGFIINYKNKVVARMSLLLLILFNSIFFLYFFNRIVSANWVG